jgi:NADH:ubiquinone oxidoreductase subunit E
VTELYDEIQEMRAIYPESRSAVMPALRAAQERYGWLTPEAFREVAEALDLTPAYCKGIATFYDMYHLAPVGRHTVEVCTNLSCALVGAQRVVEALEHELGGVAHIDQRVCGSPHLLRVTVIRTAALWRDPGGRPSAREAGR